MSDWIIQPAIRANVGLFIGLAGGTASGKTWSAMEMATGIVGPGEKFLVIDTENKRALHYADFFNFDHMEFVAPYSSARYEDAVQYGYNKGYRAIVLDSFSHEHNGAGGYLDTQGTALEEMVKRAKAKNPNKNEWELAEKLTPLSWVKPSRDRQRMLETLLACSSTIPLIFCLRAQEKSFMSKDGKLVARPTPEWEPVCGKGMMYEMTVSFMLHAVNPGMPTKIKLEKQHEELFPHGQLLGRECGKRIAEWAKGGAKKAEPVPVAAAAPPAPTVEDFAKQAEQCETIAALNSLTNAAKTQFNDADMVKVRAIYGARAAALKSAEPTNAPTAEPTEEEVLRQTINEKMTEMQIPVPGQAVKIQAFTERHANLTDFTMDELTQFYDALCAESEGQ